MQWAKWSFSVLTLFFFPSLFAANITVLNPQQQPIAGATVLIGPVSGQPFPGNTVVTDASGTAALPDAWTTALPLSISAPGYIVSTIPAALPGARTVTLSLREPAQQMEVSGPTTNFGPVPTDGRVDFGLVIPALSRSSMLSFDLSNIISPRFDRIDILGRDIDIPSNITLPQQTENYIFDFELNKPDYRLEVREPGNYQVSVTHGHFPLQRVVDAIQQGRSMFELINYFTFVESGLKQVTVEGNMSGIDLPVNQTRFNANVAVRAPTFDATQTMISLALLERGGQFVPSDLKRFNSGQSMNLKSLRDEPAPLALSILMMNAQSSVREFMNNLVDTTSSWFGPLNVRLPKTLHDAVPAQYNFSQLSFALTPAKTGASPQFLPLISAPRLNGQTLSFEKPVMSAGLAIGGTYVIYSEIESIVVGEVRTERRTRLWEIWSNEWLETLELPQIEFTQLPNRTYRWEVIYLAKPENFIGELVNPAGVDLSLVTHVTRNVLNK